MNQNYRGNDSINEFMEENMSLMRESISRAETLIKQVKEVLNELVGDNGLTPEMVRLKVEERRNDRVMNIYNAILKCLYEVEELDGKITLQRFGTYLERTGVQLKLDNRIEGMETTFKCSEREFETLKQKLTEAEIFSVRCCEDDEDIFYISIE